MIDALIGAVIAVVATSALVLLAEVVTNVETGEKNALTDYEVRLLDVVKSSHPGSVSEDALLAWMKSQGSSEF